MQTVNIALLGGSARLPFQFPLLAFPSVHTRPPSSHASLSGIFCSPDVVVGGGESAGVRSWRHSCTTAPDAPHAWGKALTKPWRGTAVDSQPDPA